MIDLRAEVTKVHDSPIAAPAADGGVTVQASGGLIVEHNTLQARQGPLAWHAAILALRGEPDAPLPMLLNCSVRTAQTEGNKVGAGNTVKTTSGACFHRLCTGARDLYGAAHKVASAVKRHAIGWLYQP
jgi:hypothetical protein